MDEQRLVAVVSPWEGLPQLVKREFRVESLPAEKKAMVWREDLQTESALEEELKKSGIAHAEIRKAKVKTKWQNVV